MSREPDEPAVGGIVKLQHLIQEFPDTPHGFNVLYLVSSRLPDGAVALADWARRRGARVVINQNGAAYPGVVRQGLGARQPADGGAADARGPRVLPERVLPRERESLDRADRRATSASSTTPSTPSASCRPESPSGSAR